MDFSTIIYSAEDGVGIITMNRPKSMNAINDEFMRELDQVIDLIEDDNNVGAVIVTGGEKFFAAGADIKYIMGHCCPVNFYTMRLSSWYNE
ncbi:MAG: enoyl-CoA hydratase/isomerase family protein [Deltaproteobacteria bacterium]|nr:enoyl-CoA hydratase/isomerase family protein [Deltaproteobacteria bacterium]MBW2113036.1 enoyl-CoA hydratase/isomerase family protein [Deltaproteobacteria bacterium]